MRKEKVRIREPRPCKELECNLPVKARGLCNRHYQQLRYWEMKRGEWEAGPCGNFGDPEGHRISAKMGGDVRAQDVESLQAAGRIGARNLAEKNPEAVVCLRKLGGEANSRDRERMRQMGKKGSEARWGARTPEEPGTTSDPSSLLPPVMRDGPLAALSRLKNGQL